MSAIGDYIHYTAAGYNRYGIGRHEEILGDTTYLLKRAKKSVCSKINQKNNTISEENKKLISRALSIGRTKDSTTEEKSRRQELEKTVFQVLQEQFNRLRQIDWEHLDTIEGELSGSAIESWTSKKTKNLKRKLTSSDKARTMSMKRINQMVEDINNLIKDISDKAALDPDIYNLQALQKIQFELMDKRTKLIQTCDFVVDKETRTILKLVKPKNKEKEEDFKQALQELNDFLAQTDLSLFYDALTQKGTLFEDDLAASILGEAYSILGKELTDKTKEKLLEDIRTAVKGGTPVTNVYHLDKFYGAGLMAKELKLETNDKKRIAIIAKNIKQKTDVYINIPEAGINNIKASAKNLSFDSGSYIHMVSASPFLFLIQDLNSKTINHYLNISIQHGEIEGRDTEEIKAKNIQQSHIYMNEILFLLSLTGMVNGRTKEQIANVLVINNNKAKSDDNRFIIVTMSEIANNIDSYKQYIEIEANGKKGKGNTTVLGDALSEVKNDFIINNDKDPTIRRISKILIQLHQIKIDVLFSKTAAKRIAAITK